MSVMATIKAAATLDTGEMARLAKRRELKRQLSKRKCIEQDIARLRAEVASIDNNVNILTANHETQVTAWRQEMDALAEQMADGPSDKLYAKRAALQQKIIDSTKALETAVANAQVEAAGVRKLMKPLQQQLADLPIEFSLAKPDTANPELLQRSFVRRRKIKFLEARLDESRKWLAANERELALARQPGPAVPGVYFDSPGKVDHEAVRLYEKRIANWKAEIASCEHEIAEALAEGNAEHRAMIEE